MRYAVVVLLGTLMGHSDVFGPGRLTVSSGPIVIYAPGESPADRKTPTQVGLLYTPELLTALAQQSPESVSARVRDAIHEQTPIVVLWTIPPIAGAPPLPRPFSAVIVERGGYSAVPRTEPLWIEQHAEDMRRLDPQRSFQDVGVMAAFPRSAFVPGHSVIIYRALPSTEPGRSTGVQRFGLIQWSGTRAPE